MQAARTNTANHQRTYKEMKLSKYIKQLQEILQQLGDTEHMFQSIDDEGNGYKHVHFSPSICYVPKHELDGNFIEGLVPQQDPEDSREEWLENWGITEEELSDDYVKAVLL